MKKHFDFLGYRKVAYLFSAFLIGLSLYAWVTKGDLKYGIDFIGGQEIVVQVEKSTDSDSVRKVLDGVNLVGATVQSFDFSEHEFSIRLPLRGDLTAAETQKQLLSALEKELGTTTLLKSDSVGAVIGEEVRSKALWAIGIGIVGILIYIAIRFEFAYALGAVVAVFHDVIVATGAYLLAGHELNGAALAAALTILGYSVNDTIVVFDRVREERAKSKDNNLERIMNDAMNFCLSRTIITSFLTLLAALSLLILGGGAIQDLSWFLVAGLIIGTYSTIYIAAPVALMWETNKRKKKN